MQRICTVILVLLMPFITIAQNTIRLTIKSFPPYHPAGSSIYAAGSFNGWNPNDEHYKFKKDQDGNYFLELKLDPGNYEYKITRGGWDKGECKKDGTPVANRSLKVKTGQTIAIAIEEWQDRFPPQPKKSTASPNVCIIDTAFLIPQLKRIRRIWIYFPEDYCDGTNKKYPVLYMQDGQNVFDEATSYSGEWGVDEFLDSTAEEKCIVVGVDHGSEKRLNEYNPYDNDRFGKGEGNQYVDFLVHTLKPFIDKNYRTKKGKKNTFIAGSSMGGLISMYAVLKYPKVFGGAGVFSPSFWITESKIDTKIKSSGGRVNAKIYFYCGKKEGEEMVSPMLKAFEEMAATSKSKMTTVIRDDGKHNELTWRNEFPLFYKWLMSQNKKLAD